jgi:hypothetical protein
MRDGKGHFYRLLKVDKLTRKTIQIYRELRYKMMKEIPNKHKRDAE